MSFFHRQNLSSYKELTQPIYRVPRSLQEALCIYRISEAGIFELEKKTGDHFFDKGYLFEDINYIAKDESERESILLKWCKILNSMNVNFKITIAKLNRNMDDFLEKILYPDPESTALRDYARANNHLIRSNLQKGTPELQTIHLFTISCKVKNWKEAVSYFNVLETALTPIFLSLKSHLIPLSAQDRLQILHRCFRMGRETEFTWNWEEAARSSKRWKSEILPGAVRQEKAYLEMDDKYLCTLYVQQYPSQIDDKKVMPSFTQAPFPMLLTMDVAPIPRNALKEHLLTAYANNEYAISREAEAQIKNNNFSSGISYTKKKTREDLEMYMNQVDENDENAFYLGMSLTLYADTYEELQERVDTMTTTASSHGLILVPVHYRQWEAFQTGLPAGIRLVDYMRMMLTNAMASLQPFYAQEIMEFPGIYYGVNQHTKNLVIGNRKQLANPNGMVFGIPGSGKSMFIKTEIGQVKISTKDDIFIIDPQNEFAQITDAFGGQFYDFATDAQVYLNPLEIPETIRYTDDPVLIENFVGNQSAFLQAFCSSIMVDLNYNGFHTTIIDRVTRMLYEQEWEKVHPQSPTLKEFRELLGQQPEPEAREIYIPLEAFTEGSMNIFAQESNVELQNPMVTFGLKRIPKSMWKPAMMIIIHVLHNRMDFNQNLQKATWFYVDEAQEVCKDELSANELNKCFLTFRKFGGICTAIMQNLSKALVNQTTTDMISNSEFKVFLAQAGADRNAAATILDLSAKELLVMTESDVGKCLFCWGKKIIPLDTVIPKGNPLYPLYSTNFHERAALSPKKE